MPGDQPVPGEHAALEVLERFGEAWNRHDLDAMMSFMADDCVYCASFGPDLDGMTYEGRAAVREGFARFLAAFPDGRFEDVRSFAAGNRAASQWTFVFIGADGERMRVCGCDLYALEDGKIRRKDAFRKERRTERQTALKADSTAEVDMP
jgi:steroid delta-isomerase-like uncharacterized protein